LLDRAERSLSEPAWDGAGISLGEELLRPSVIYAPALARLRASFPVHAFVHVTGGGIAGNLVRVLPDDCDAVVRRGSWSEPRIFAEVQAAGDVPDAEMEHVFNLGLGMLAVVAPDDAPSALEALVGAGFEAWDVGEVMPGSGRVTIGS
jgi:phosphoribosylformylglycinamidine cyclo-ligase